MVQFQTAVHMKNMASPAVTSDVKLDVILQM